MKNFVILHLFILNIACGLFQNDYSSFSEFINVHLRLPEVVKRNCTWQYVIIKTKIDKDNILTSYEIENKTITDLTKTFSYLKGYQFNKNINFRNHNVVFFLSLVNERVEDCDINPTNAKNEANNIFKKYKRDNSKKNPENLYIDDVITSLIYDSMK